MVIGIINYVHAAHLMHSRGRRARHLLNQP